MKNLLENIEEILLMGPGPSCVPPQVYVALSRKTLGHLDPYFLGIMEEIKEMLRLSQVPAGYLPVSRLVSAKGDDLFC